MGAFTSRIKFEKFFPGEESQLTEEGLSSSFYDVINISESKTNLDFGIDPDSEDYQHNLDPMKSLNHCK